MDQSTGDPATSGGDGHDSDTEAWSDVDAMQAGPLTLPTEQLQLSPLPLPLAEDQGGIVAPAAPHSAFGATVGGALAAAASRRPSILDAQVLMCRASFRLGIPVDVEALLRAVPNTEMGSQGSTLKGCVFIRCLRQPRYTAIVNAKGTVRVFTSYDGEPARLAAKRAARLMQQRYNSAVTFKHYRMTNVQVQARLGFRVDVRGLAQRHRERREQLTEASPPDAGGSSDSTGLRGANGVGLKVVEAGSGSVTLEVAESQGTRKVRVKTCGTLQVHCSVSKAEAIAAMETVAPALVAHAMWW